MKSIRSSNSDMDNRVLEGETTAQSSNAPSQAGQSSRAPRKRKNHRGGKKKRSRRKSFAISQDDVPHDEDTIQDPALDAARREFYRMHGRSFSNTSIDSEVLLDHREQQPFIRPRRPSVAPNMSSSFQFTSSRLQTVQGGDSAGDDDEDDHFDEDAPLLSSSGRLKGDSAFATGGYGSSEHRRSRPQSQRDSSRSSSRRKHLRPFFPQSESYNVNYPPSVPGSPPMRPTERSGVNFGDALLRDEIAPEGSPRRLDSRGDLGDSDHSPHISPIQRRHTIALQAEEDVCFPQEGLSELGDDEANVRDGAVYRGGRGRRRRGRWPDLGILDEWSRLEKEGRSDERRAKKITEPQLINGRLRPVHKGWYRAEEDAPYRFTYFNEEFQSTIHSQTISELVQPGGSFKELFLPDPPILSDSSDDEEEELGPDAALHYRSIDSLRNGETKVPTRQSSLLGQLHHNSETLKEGHMSPTKEGEASKTSQKTSGTATPGSVKSPATEKATLHEQPEKPEKPEKPTRYGERPVWWLDVLSPTEAEMKVLSKAFGIHPLTAEDIMMQEAREKVELFRHYYLVNYRSFDQDQSSENFLEPVNVYVVVFREGVISFHFSMTPHPANVRRRVRQLRDYMILSADWISYAIIDDITDVFVPLIQNIEEEVDDIDDAILRLHSSSDPASSDHNKKDSEKRSDGAGESSAAPESGADMLRRVGDCRKKVMMLYRLLGNKADVIKGFAKRCNEHWEVAPRSEIGLYLGDIQDHIVTMTANLSHYEKILARSHGNYLAQINIRMNERQEQTADVLGRLTVLGTIVLPMNIITGLWGMNVWVPGQEWEGDLKWFWAITAGLLCFGLACYAIAKRVYKIV